MVEVKEYIGEEIVYEGKNTQVYRGKSKVGGEPVIIKISRTEYPGPRELAKFRKEFEIGTSLDFEGIARPIALENHNNGLALVLEDFGGISLRKVIETKKVSLQAFLKIAQRLAEVLGVIHRHEIIHMDIKPHNIIINLQTGRVVITDFGISTQLSRENPTIVSPGKLEGTLAYISPEQTGRMNRAIDYRTDFYSLGITYYELLTESPPFSAGDPMEMVHNHIAVQPRSPSEVRPEVPRVVSDIVMRLLSKNAEDRYQSAAGLKADIDECLRQFKVNNGKIEPFELGRNDRATKFQIPQKLYGREAETKNLMEAFEQASKGSSEILFVRGFSGIGKSALVNEVQKPIVEHRGYFISGKFDQFKRDIPYSSLIQAFQELIRQLLTEPPEKIEIWKSSIQKALGSNGQVIVDVIPEVELIIGKQEPVPELGPNESQNRFNLVFKNFVNTFAKKKHPLVIFLDDLQWSDGATLNLIQMLINDPESKYIFFMCAYRDNEVDSHHPVATFIENLEKGYHPPKYISLGPITLSDVTILIAETLQCDTGKAEPLAKLVHSKTNGNPFFVSEFLKTLYKNKVLNVSLTSGEWQWELSKIQKMDITDNVVELMASKIQELPIAAQKMVQLASCVGNKFDLRTLSTVSEKSVKQVALDIKEPLREGLIQPIGDEYKFESEDSNAPFKFLHDRVQQAAYGLIPEEDKQKVHLSIGRHLLSYAKTSEEREEKVFDISNHMNTGRDLIAKPEEKLEVARLNLLAGKKAKSSAAYGAAAKYLEAGISLLPADSWENEHELTLDLMAERADCETLNSNFEESEKLVEEILPHVKDVLQRTRVFETRIRTLNAEGKLVPALGAAREILRPLGVSLPRRPNFYIHVGPALAATVVLTFLKGEFSLLKAPPMTDPKKIAAMKIMTETAASAYQSDFNLFSLYIFAMTRLSYRFGLAPATPYGIGLYSMAWTGVLGIYSWGEKYGKLSLDLLDKLGAKSREFRSKTIMLNNTFIKHWVRPIRDTFDDLMEGGQAGLESGDAEYMGYNFFFHGLNGIFSTERLESLNRDFEKSHKTVLNFNQGQALNVIKVWGQFVHNLLGRTDDPTKLSGDYMNEEELLQFFQDTSYSTGISYLHQAKAMLYYLFGDYEKARVQMAESRREEFAVMAMVCSAGLVFYDSLILLKLYSKATRSEKWRYFWRILMNQFKMKRWARSAPVNFKHRYDLVEAEKARVAGNVSKALENYDRAIDGARKSQFILEEALANELAAEFYLSLGKEKVARTYMTDARYGYSRWGSEVKIRDLDQRHPEFMRKIMAAEGMADAESMTITTTKTTNGATTGSATSSLDLGTVMKASQALSSEIFLDQLLAKLMNIALENAGAQRGSLILESDEQLVIEAQGEAGGELEVMKSIPIEDSTFAAPSVVQYVERTRENVVLGDASREGRFTKAPYVMKYSPKSVLCMPIIKQGELFGILYLENNLTTNAFTQDRVDVLKILASQAAISLENAKLISEETERQKLQKEMEMAKDVQMSILPEFPEDDAYRITAHMTPAEQVGGDYYDYYRVNADRWIAIGDVTGHGLNSGLMMLMAQTGFSTYLNASHQPDTLELFVSLNKTLHDNMATRTKQGLYMTFTAMRADQDGNFEHVGKHEDILVYRQATKKVEIVGTDGFWMGVVPDVQSMVRKSAFRLEPGDFLTLYTDGVIECRNKAGEQFDTSRLVEAIEKHADQGIERVREEIIKSCLEFMDVMDDDITVFLMQKK